ncbi:hypothetical protein MRB53_013916 [Persea americana]|uniref:Uncharacterized protein n=1 Tax=Persea americana TaxID=3435 RepID=A0ACC2K9D5_PERAE|nr:hypothetical protein MRB53_013916 [Persea americana]
MRVAGELEDGEMVSILPPLLRQRWPSSFKIQGYENTIERLVVWVLSQVWIQASLWHLYSSSALCMVCTRLQKYRSLNEIMAEHSEVNSTVTMDGLVAMMAEMRTTMEALQKKIATMEQQTIPNGNGTVVRPPNGNNTVVTPVLPTPRLRCPNFDGTDPEIWLNEVVSYMNFHGVPQEQWVMVVSFHLEKEAKRWYNWLQTQIVPITWAAFT